MKLRAASSRHARPHAGACPSWRPSAMILLLGAFGASCTLRPSIDTAGGDATASTSTGTNVSTATTAPLPDATTSTSPGTTTSVDPTTGGQTPTGGSDTTDPSCSGFFDGCSDLWGGGGKECDNWTQDCPPGQKCMPYSGDGDNSWESLGCFPVMENPGKTGDPCTIEGSGVSGIDSCDVAHMCWNTDPDTGEGTCVAFCTGSPDQPMCDPGFSCTITSNSILILCLSACNPIAQDCPGDDLCIPNPQNSEEFICVLDASGEEGQEFDPCEYANACDPGLMCQDPVLATECDQQALGCCLPFCDTTMPICTGQNAECIPWYEPGMAPPGLENVGLCGIPQ